MTCKVAKCLKPLYARGFCVIHYDHWRKYGNPLRYLPRGRPRTAVKDKINGYRRITVNSVRDYEHRHVWRQYYGAVPSKHHVHHINGNKVDNRIENLCLLTPHEHRHRHDPNCKRWPDSYGAGRPKMT